LIDDMLSFASSLDKKDMSSDASIDEVIDDSSLASHMDFKPRDVKALYRLINDNLPLIIKTHRASDIIKLIELKKYLQPEFNYYGSTRGIFSSR